MSLRIRQIVFAAGNLTATVRQFESMLDLKVAYRDPGVAAFGLENALMPIGDQFLEIVAPTRSDTAASRHLERHGDSAYMLILQTDDLARDRARLASLGVRLVWESSHPDMSSVHLHPKDIGAAIVSIDQATPPGSWRWAGPDWQDYVSSTGAQAVLEATIAARDPQLMARRWSQVLGLDAPQKVQNAWCIQLTEGAINFTPSSNGAERISEYLLATPTESRSMTICGTRFRTQPLHA